MDSCRSSADTATAASNESGRDSNVNNSNSTATSSRCATSSSSSTAACTLRHLTDAIAKIHRQKQCPSVVRIVRAVRQALQYDIDQEEVLRHLEAAAAGGALVRIENNGVISYKEPPRAGQANTNKTRSAPVIPIDQPPSKKQAISGNAQRLMTSDMPFSHMPTNKDGGIGLATAAYYGAGGSGMGGCDPTSKRYSNDASHQRGCLWPDYSTGMMSPSMNSSRSFDRRFQQMTSGMTSDAIAAGSSNFFDPSMFNSGAFWSADTSPTRPGNRSAIDSLPWAAYMGRSSGWTPGAVAQLAMQNEMANLAAGYGAWPTGMMVGGPAAMYPSMYPSSAAAAAMYPGGAVSNQMYQSGAAGYGAASKDSSTGRTVAGGMDMSMMNAWGGRGMEGMMDPWARWSIGESYSDIFNRQQALQQQQQQVLQQEHLKPEQQQQQRTHQQHQQQQQMSRHSKQHQDTKQQHNTDYHGSQQQQDQTSKQHQTESDNKTADYTGSTYNQVKTPQQTQAIEQQNQSNVVTANLVLPVTCQASSSAQSIDGANCIVSDLQACSTSDQSSSSNFQQQYGCTEVSAISNPAVNTICTSVGNNFQGCDQNSASDNNFKNQTSNEGGTCSEIAGSLTSCLDSASAPEILSGCYDNNINSNIGNSTLIADSQNSCSANTVITMGSDLLQSGVSNANSIVAAASSEACNSIDSSAMSSRLDCALLSELSSEKTNTSAAPTSEPYNHNHPSNDVPPPKPISPAQAADEKYFLEITPNLLTSRTVELVGNQFDGGGASQLGNADESVLENKEADDCFTDALLNKTSHEDCNSETLASDTLGENCPTHQYTSFNLSHARSLICGNNTTESDTCKKVDDFHEASEGSGSDIIELSSSIVEHNTQCESETVLKPGSSESSLCSKSTDDVVCISDQEKMENTVADTASSFKCELTDCSTATDGQHSVEKSDKKSDNMSSEISTSVNTPANLEKLTNGFSASSINASKWIGLIIAAVKSCLVHSKSRTGGVKFHDIEKHIRSSYRVDKVASQKLPKRIRVYLKQAIDSGDLRYDEGLYYLSSEGTVSTKSEPNSEKKDIGYNSKNLKGYEAKNSLTDDGGLLKPFCTEANLNSDKISSNDASILKDQDQYPVMSMSSSATTLPRSGRSAEPDLVLPSASTAREGDSAQVVSNNTSSGAVNSDIVVENKCSTSVIQSTLKSGSTATRTDDEVTSKIFPEVRTASTSDSSSSKLLPCRTTSSSVPENAEIKTELSGGNKSSVVVNSNRCSGGDCDGLKAECGTDAVDSLTNQSSVMDCGEDTCNKSTVMDCGGDYVRGKRSLEDDDGKSAKKCKSDDGYDIKKLKVSIPSQCNKNLECNPSVTSNVLSNSSTADANHGVVMEEKDQVQASAVPKYLVDGLSQFFTPSNKRSSRVSQNSSRASAATDASAVTEPCVSKTSGTSSVGSLAHSTISTGTSKSNGSTSTGSGARISVNKKKLKKERRLKMLVRCEGERGEQWSKVKDESDKACPSGEKDKACPSDEKDEINVIREHIDSRDKPSCLTINSNNNNSLKINSMHETDNKSLVSERSNNTHEEVKDTRVSSVVNNKVTSTTQSCGTKSASGRSREQLIDGLSKFFTATGKRRACVVKRESMSESSSGTQTKSCSVGTDQRSEDWSSVASGEGCVRTLLSRHRKSRHPLLGDLNRAMSDSASLGGDIADDNMSAAASSPGFGLDVAGFDDGCMSSALSRSQKRVKPIFYKSSGYLSEVASNCSPSVCNNTVESDVSHENDRTIVPSKNGLYVKQSDELCSKGVAKIKLKRLDSLSVKPSMIFNHKNSLIQSSGCDKTESLATENSSAMLESESDKIDKNEVKQVSDRVTSLKCEEERVKKLTCRERRRRSVSLIIDDEDIVCPPISHHDEILFRKARKHASERIRARETVGGSDEVDVGSRLLSSDVYLCGDGEELLIGSTPSSELMRGVRKVYICQYCMKMMRCREALRRHENGSYNNACANHRKPPGREVFRHCLGAEDSCGEGKDKTSADISCSLLHIDDKANASFICNLFLLLQCVTSSSCPVVHSNMHSFSYYLLITNCDTSGAFKILGFLLQDKMTQSFHQVILPTRADVYNEFFTLCCDWLKQSSSKQEELDQLSRILETDVLHDSLAEKTEAASADKNEKSNTFLPVAWSEERHTPHRLKKDAHDIDTDNTKRKTVRVCISELKAQELKRMRCDMDVKERVHIKSGRSISHQTSISMEASTDQTHNISNVQHTQHLVSAGLEASRSEQAVEGLCDGKWNQSTQDSCTTDSSTAPSNSTAISSSIAEPSIKLSLVSDKLKAQESTTMATEESSKHEVLGNISVENNTVPDHLFVVYQKPDVDSRAIVQVLGGQPAAASTSSTAVGAGAAAVTPPKPVMCTVACQTDAYESDESSSEDESSSDESDDSSYESTSESPHNTPGAGAVHEGCAEITEVNDRAVRCETKQLVSLSERKLGEEDATDVMIRLAKEVVSEDQCSSDTRRVMESNKCEIEQNTLDESNAGSSIVVNERSSNSNRDDDLATDCVLVSGEGDLNLDNSKRDNTNDGMAEEEENKCDGESFDDDDDDDCDDDDDEMGGMSNELIEDCMNSYTGKQSDSEGSDEAFLDCMNKIDSSQYIAGYNNMGHVTTSPQSIADSISGQLTSPLSNQSFNMCSGQSPAVNCGVDYCNNSVESLSPATGDLCGGFKMPVDECGRFNSCGSGGGNYYVGGDREGMMNSYCADMTGADVFSAQSPSMCNVQYGPCGPSPISQNSPSNSNMYCNMITGSTNQDSPNMFNAMMANQSSPINAALYNCMPTPSPTNSSSRSFNMASPSSYPNQQLQQQADRSCPSAPVAAASAGGQIQQQQQQLMSNGSVEGSTAMKPWPHHYNISEDGQLKYNNEFSAPAANLQMSGSFIAGDMNRFEMEHSVLGSNSTLCSQDYSKQQQKLPMQNHQLQQNKTIKYQSSSAEVSSANHSSKNQRRSTKTNKNAILPSARNHSVAPNVTIQPGTNIITSYDIMNNAVAAAAVQGGLGMSECDCRHQQQMLSPGSCYHNAYLTAGMEHSMMSSMDMQCYRCVGYPNQQQHSHGQHRQSANHHHHLMAYPGMVEHAGGFGMGGMMRDGSSYGGGMDGNGGYSGMPGGARWAM